MARWPFLKGPKVTSHWKPVTGKEAVVPFCVVLLGVLFSHLPVTQR